MACSDLAARRYLVQGAAMAQLAIFDVDGTLVVPSTGWLLARGLYEQGLLRRMDLLHGAYHTVLMRLHRLDYEEVAREAMRFLAGREIVEVRACFRLAFERHMRSAFVPETVRRLCAHHAAGDSVVLISGTSRLIGELIAEILPVDAMACADAEEDGTLVSDRVVRPLPYGQGKVVWAERLAAKLDLCLDDAVLYTDSLSDRPLLERVGRQVCVNPDPFLGRLARRREWTILRDRRRADVRNLVSG